MHEIINMSHSQMLGKVESGGGHLAENASFGPNLAVFGPKIQLLGGSE